MAEISATQWRELTPLLDELLDAQEETRALRLAQIRSSDGGLANRLETLLQQRTAADRDAFLEGNAAFTLAHEPSLAGQTIGAYTLLEPIGQGGMGSVWRAERSDGRYQAKVAVKLLNLALIGHGGVERFSREGSMLARLSHPNIARLLDAGVSPSGQPYLVLEYIDGMPIDAWCDARSSGIEGRLRLFLDVLAAAAHAHSNLILHRDLKPSNILVAPNGDVKLLDFGIGKLIEGQTGAAAPTELTQLAGRAFTPDFAAPEQITQGDVTTATDVYALGVLLYLLLTGRHPTAHPSATQVDRLRAVVEVDAARPSDATAGTAASDAASVATARATTPHQLVRALRGDLDNILAKALKKSPAERYQTVNAFAGDLQRYLNHEPVSARPDSLGYRVSKFVRRYRVGVGLVVLTLLILIGGIVGTAWQAQEARRAQTLAETSAAEARTEREAAQFEARVARANHEFVSQLFGDAMRVGESNEMRAQLDRARDLLRKRYADDPVVHSLLLFQVAGRYAELREHKRTAEIMREIETLSMQANDISLRAMVECTKAYFLLTDGKSEAAKPHVVEGMSLMQKMTRPMTSVGFECYRADAMLASATGEHAHGVARMERWLGQLERDGLGKTRAYLNSVASLAYIHYKAGELVPALAVARRARALNEALGSEATLSSQTELDLEADLLFQLGRMADAIEVDREMLKRFADSGAAPPPTFVIKPAWHAIVAGNAEDGVESMRSVLPKYERDGPEGVARALTLDIAAALVAQGRYSDARSMIHRYEARLTSGPARPRDRVEGARVGVELALATGDVGALGTTLNALETALTAGSVPRLTSLRAYLAAGLGQLAQGDPEKAREHGGKVMKLATAKVIDGQGSAWVGAAHLLLARVALADSNPAEARQHLTLAEEQFADTLHPGHRWRKAVESLSTKL